MKTAVLSTVTLATLSLAVLVTGENFDCTHYQPGGPCTLDNIPFCLMNGTIVIGRCDAQRAVCRENQKIDETFASCNSPTKFDCNQYDPLICARDLLSFCLTNGTIVRGSCSARRAVCVERQQIDDDFSSCNQRSMKDGSSASSMSAAISLLLAALCFSIRVWEILHPFLRKSNHY